MSDGKRPGEVSLGFDPGTGDGPTVAFIGKVRSPWSRGNCPKNIGRARDTGESARIDLAPGYAPGLLGLQTGQPVIVLYWMHQTRRDLIRQCPHHTDGCRGTFALRSPLRPNPLAMSTVRITSLDEATGTIGIDAIDCFDGTPVVDIKPWLETVDLPPNQPD